MEELGLVFREGQNLIMTYLEQLGLMNIFFCISTYILYHSHCCDLIVDKKQLQGRRIWFDSACKAYNISGRDGMVAGVAHM